MATLSPRVPLSANRLARNAQDPSQNSGSIVSLSAIPSPIPKELSNHSNVVCPCHGSKWPANAQVPCRYMLKENQQDHLQHVPDESTERTCVTFVVPDGIGRLGSKMATELSELGFLLPLCLTTCLCPATVSER